MNDTTCGIRGSQSMYPMLYQVTQEKSIVKRYERKRNEYIDLENSMK